MSSRTESRRRKPAPARLPHLRQRTAGILLHLTSLPGPHGSGDLGPEAGRLVEFLARARQRWWQMLPVGPIGYGNSPYSSFSSFAGGPHLISLELLARDGLLERADLDDSTRLTANRVRFGPMLEFRQSCLRLAFDRFRKRRRGAARFKHFCTEHRHWLDDYALFSALKRAYRLVAWTDWDRGVALRDAATLRSARRTLRDEVEYEQFLQYVFDEQWFDLKRGCNRKGIGLIGDLPIFVNHDSCDVWANQQLFHLDERGQPTVVSGVPPDYFSKSGQRWGHPLYKWDEHARSQYRWWATRFGGTLRRYDAVRIDHFLGFNRLWNVPATARTARRGKWQKTPGDEIFQAVQNALGQPQIIAEDLGLLVQPAAELRDRWGFPGMRVLQFAFDGTKKARYDQPHRYPHFCVAYTGTHDNNTTVGWFDELPKRGAKGRDGLNVRNRVLRYLDAEAARIHWSMIRTLYASAANTVIVPMQDALGLGGAARMNFPSTTGQNWEWRMRSKVTSDRLAEKLARLVDLYERGTGIEPDRAVAPEL